MSWSYKMDWCLEQGLGEEQVQLFIIIQGLGFGFQIGQVWLWRAEFSRG